MRKFFTRNGFLLFLVTVASFLLIYYIFKDESHNQNVVPPKGRPMQSYKDQIDKKLNNSPEKSSEMHHIPPENRIINLNSIQHDVLAPKDTQNVFFIFDSITKNDRPKKLNFRDICSVESAALRHPNHIVFIIILTLDETAQLEVTKGFYGLPYKNLRFVKIDALNFLQNTPWNSLTKMKQFNKLGFKNISKLIRLLLLWKYGGIFVDHEMIIMKSLENHQSFLCSDRDLTIVDKVIKLDDKSIIEMLINRIVKDLQRDKGRDQIATLEMKSIQNFCGKSLGENNVKICQGFNLMPKEFCLPLTSSMESKLFDKAYKDKIMKELDNATIVHLWNYNSKNVKIKRDKSTAASQLMLEACPKTCGIETRSDF